jgi:hypothetical protein
MAESKVVWDRAASSIIEVLGGRKSLRTQNEANIVRWWKPISPRNSQT